MKEALSWSSLASLGELILRCEGLQLYREFHYRLGLQLKSYMLAFLSTSSRLLRLGVKLRKERWNPTSGEQAAQRSVASDQQI